MAMPTGGAPMEKKSMSSPDETRTFEKEKEGFSNFFYFTITLPVIHGCRIHK